MQISAANLIAAQQAAQAALAAKQAARAAAPAFAAALSDFKAEPVKAATEAAPPVPAQAAKPMAGARLGQHIDITV